MFWYSVLQLFHFYVHILRALNSKWPRWALPTPHTLVSAHRYSTPYNKPTVTNQHQPFSLQAQPQSVPSYGKRKHQGNIATKRGTSSEVKFANPDTNRVRYLVVSTSTDDIPHARPPACPPTRWLPLHIGGPPCDSIDPQGSAVVHFYILHPPLTSHTNAITSTLNPHLRGLQRGQESKDMGKEHTMYTRPQYAPLIKSCLDGRSWLNLLSLMCLLPTYLPSNLPYLY